MANKQYLHTSLSFGLTDSGEPDAEALARIDRALAFTKAERGDVFVLGGGMGTFAKKRGAPSLAAAGETYLRKKRGWTGGILNRAPDKDTNTVDEIVTLWANAKLVETSPFWKAIARPTTSWWHAWRTWWICLIIFGKPVRVHMSRSTLPWRIILREIFFHECPAFLRSCREAWKKKHTAPRPVTF